ncbi:membrane protein [Cryptosporangium arvum]|uniref:DoxX family protein n=1 Tax=Cryptosporangium arvum DSM 44712 TaxID=927661 RepID=A0A010ZUW6_9ACTN|nr:membrane protein [Cryptosporangium arvum]EXG82489.1 DoxX family protein [Cryptosporangium arvum DSM 44712]
MATTHGKQHRLHIPDSLHLTAPDSPAALYDTPDGRTATATRIVLAATRIVVGWTFLWAFVDKVFGLGYATPAGKGWIDGGSPTQGFLANGAKGPFEGLYHDLAGTAFANWAFMLGLLGIGVAMTLGIGMRIAGVSGSLLYVLMWTVALPPENNPITDDHILGALIVAALVLLGAGNYFGFGTWWRQTALVQRFPWLT